MTWCYNVRGSDYHWITDLYERLALPVLPAVVRACHKAVEQRMTGLNKQKTVENKQRRIRQKMARAEDQEERKKWGKRQAILHSYGDAVEKEHDENEDEALVEEARNLLPEASGNVTIISGKQYKCGARYHLRTSHCTCPLNKKNLAK